MGKRHPNHRRVKKHRSYTVEEVARLFDIHKNTVRCWFKNGLPALDAQRPALIYGPDLINFLQQRKAKRKQKCKEGEFYCMRCRVPRRPAENMVEYTPLTDQLGNLVAICPVCNAIMNRCVSLVKVRSVCAGLEVTFPDELKNEFEEIRTVE